MIALLITIIGPHWLPLTLAVLCAVLWRRWRLAERRLSLYMTLVAEKEAARRKRGTR